MMPIRDIIKFVYRNMKEKKSRVFLTISGIIIGIFTFSLILLSSGGIENAIVGQFSAFGLDVIVVQPYDAPGGGPPSGSGLDDTDIAKIEQVVREYKYIAPVIFHTTQFEYNREKIPIVTLAYPDEYWPETFEDIGAIVEEGRNLRAGDRGVIVLGYKTAKDTFEKEVDLGSSLKFEGRNYRVVGILESRGDLFVDNSVLMPFDDIKEVSGQDTYSGIRISFIEGADIDRYQEAILRKLNPNSKEKNVQLSTPSQAIDQFGSLILMIQVVLGMFSGFVLVVGGINVMNTLYSSILERINEISVIKALGGTNRDVMVLFLAESGVLGIIGAVIGFLLAYILAETLSYLITTYAGFNVPVYFEVGTFIWVVLGTTFFSMVFGTYPAVKAAKVNPADNLRDE